MLQTVAAAKKAAQTLKSFLAERKFPIKLGVAQDAIARLNGARGWNEFSAQAKSEASPPVTLSWTYLHETLGFFSEGTGGIEGVLVKQSTTDIHRCYKKFHYVDIPVLLTLDREIMKVADAVDMDFLNCPDTDDLQDQLVFDWGTEWDGEGLSLGDLRHAAYRDQGEWQLKDGRILSFFKTQVIGNDGACTLPGSIPTLIPNTGKPALVQAQIHSDDWGQETLFNAVPWLKTASVDELCNLAVAGWRDAAAADVVALAMEESNPRIAALLNCCRASHRRRNAVGFEVSVDYEAALVWLRQHRPDVYPEVARVSNH